jgi:hypothetical protein
MTDNQDQTAYGLAFENRHVPGIQEALTWAGRDSVTSWGSWNERFKDYFGMLVHTGEPIKKLSPSVLWMCFMNLSRDDMDSKEAINVFIGPIAESLALRMDQGHTSGLEKSDVAQLAHQAGQTARGAIWLAEENRGSVQKLASAAINQWLRMYDQDRNGRPKTNGLQAAQPMPRP